MSYSVHIPRCTHIKTNGTQCGSPALRGRRFCFFHKNWHGQRIQLNAQPAPLDHNFTLPVLEDANAIQVALMQVMQLLLSGQIEHKTAGLLLYALQTAAANLRETRFEPFCHEEVVIDPGSVSETPLDKDVWNASDFEVEEEEEEEEDEATEEKEEEDSAAPAKVDVGELRNRVRRIAFDALERMGYNLPPELRPPDTPAITKAARPASLGPAEGSVVEALSPVPLE
jgi:hypothetical protein